MPDNLTQEQIATLKAAYGQAEIVINGELWTRFGGLGEWKVSPHGESGDYDTDSFWVDFEEIKNA